MYYLVAQLVATLINYQYNGEGEVKMNERKPPYEWLYWTMTILSVVAIAVGLFALGYAVAKGY